jgi:hypothetical protein
VDDVVRRADGQVDAVLGAHDADVRHEMPSAPAQGGHRVPAVQPQRVGAGADDGNVGAGLAAALDRDPRIRPVGRDDVVGRPEGGALQSEQPPARQAASAREPGVVELGAQVVVVEDEAGAVAPTEEPGERPEDVGRVARLEHLEAAGAPGAQHQPRRGEEGVGVLEDEARGAAPRRVGRVLEDGDVVDDVVHRIALALRAHDGHVVPGRRQRLALQPDPTVEGHRQVLDDDQHAGAPGRLLRSDHAVGRGGRHAVHPRPS